MTNCKIFCSFIFILVLLCCVSVVSAVSNDTMDNIVFEMDSNDEFISVSSDNELASSVDESKSVLQIQLGNLNTNDVLRDEDSFDDDWDDDEGDDWEGGDENELDEDSINGILDDIKSSTSQEYYNFVKYLLNTKKFSFNQNSVLDGGYKIFATEDYKVILYDGGT